MSVTFFKVKFFEHAALGLVQFLEIRFAEADAHCAVSVGLNGLLLYYRAGSCLHDSDRSAGTVSGEYLRHSDLSSQNKFLHLIYLPGYWFRRTFRADSGT